MADRRPDYTPRKLTRRQAQYVRELLFAQGRMLNQWAEADEPLRKELWSDLHEAGDELRYAFDATDRPWWRRWHRA